MKKIKFAALILMGMIISLNACKDDDDPTPEPEPTTTYNIGTTVYTIDEENATVSIKDNGEGTGTKTLSSDTTWILDGFVFVEDGQTLTIEPGTMIQGLPGQEENASALIVKMGGTIEAAGTANDPIVFTGLGDNYDGSGYLTEVQGLWGGLVILGKATTNNTANKRIEGVPEEYQAFYGGTDDADNSGTLQYVSIRHGGTDIGAGNEINGLTLGAVGSGTIFDHIEVVSNIDDGVEFFGGAAELKHILVAYCGDDSYDYDEGFHGKGQFWVTIQREGTGDRLGEHDGGTSDDEQSTPYATPVIYNATYISNGSGRTITFRDNAGGTYANSIFTNTEKGIDVEWRTDKAQNSIARLNAGDLVIQDNLFINVAGDVVADMIKVSEENGTAPAGTATDLVDHFNDNSNAVSSINVGYDSEDDLYLIPAAGEASNGSTPPATFFDDVTYQGAFEPGGSNWAEGWTLTFAN